MTARAEAWQRLGHEGCHQTMLRGDLLHSRLEKEGAISCFRQLGELHVHLVLPSPTLRVPILDGNSKCLQVLCERPDDVFVGCAPIDAVCAQPNREWLKELRTMAFLLKALLALPIEKELQLGCKLWCPDGCRAVDHPVEHSPRSDFDGPAVEEKVLAQHEISTIQPGNDTES